MRRNGHTSNSTAESRLPGSTASRAACPSAGRTNSRLWSFEDPRSSIGLVLSLATPTLVGLRYLGIDTAVGDAAVPTLADWLAALNNLLPTP